MARPAKSYRVRTGHMTKEEIDARAAKEEALRGKGTAIKPTMRLSPSQKKIFRRILSFFADAELLGEADSYIITNAAVIIDRMQQLDALINATPALLADRETISARSHYQQAFARVCNELCLSPAGRAKIGTLSLGAAKEKDDPLLKALEVDTDG